MKNETNHTPGPWRVSEFDGVHQYAAIEAGDGINDLLRICDIPSWPCATEEMEANARLIAAAPDLLNALGEAVEAFDAPNWGCMDAARDKMFDAIENARAAIAKATGKGDA